MSTLSPGLQGKRQREEGADWWRGVNPGTWLGGFLSLLEVSMASGISSRQWHVSNSHVFRAPSDQWCQYSENQKDPLREDGRTLGNVALSCLPAVTFPILSISCLTKASCPILVPPPVYSLRFHFIKGLKCGELPGTPDSIIQTIILICVHQPRCYFNSLTLFQIPMNKISVSQAGGI